MPAECGRVAGTMDRDTVTEVLAAALRLRGIASQSLCVSGRYSGRLGLPPPFLWRMRPASPGLLAMGCPPCPEQAGRGGVCRRRSVSQSRYSGGLVSVSVWPRLVLVPRGPSPCVPSPRRRGGLPEGMNTLDFRRNYTRLLPPLRPSLGVVSRAMVPAV